MGTWASAVTTAVAPLCWENKVMLFTVSGADSITRLPHLGYIIRTQPNTEPAGHALRRLHAGPDGQEGCLPVGADAVRGIESTTRRPKC